MAIEGRDREQANRYQISAIRRQEKVYREFTERIGFAEKRKGKGERGSGVNLGYGDELV